MPETTLTAPILPSPSLETPQAALPAFLTLRVQVALLVLFVAFAASVGLAAAPAVGAGGTVNLNPIVNLLCGLVRSLTAGTLLGAAGTLLVIIFGWNKLMGEQNAFQSLKNGVIGGLIILAAGTIATALFGNGCAVA